MKREVQLSNRHIKLIKAECRLCAPNEACGVLIGRDNAGTIVVEKIVPITNSRPSDRSFELDPGEHYQAWDLADREGLDIVGIYHTHPHSRAAPSAWDRETMEHEQSVWIIAGTDGVRGYEWREGVQQVNIIEVQD